MWDLTHLDEHGNVCTHHAPVVPDELLALATVGSRAPSFHHDLASKLQGLMMAIDEISEISGDTPPPLTRAIDTAHTTLKEVLALLNANRALTKAPVATRTTLSEIVARAGERVYVTVRGSIPPAAILVPIPAVTHALALVLDVAGGPGRGRSVDASTVVADGIATLTIPAAAEAPPNASESLALASFVLRRERGSLTCAAGGTKLLVRLPVVS